MALFFLCVLVSVSLLTNGDQSELRSQYEQLQSDIRYNLGPDNDMLFINPEKRRLQMEKERPHTNCLLFLSSGFLKMSYNATHMMHNAWSSSSSWLERFRWEQLGVSVCPLMPGSVCSHLQSSARLHVSDISKLFMFSFCSLGKKIEDRNGETHPIPSLRLLISGTAHGLLFPSSSFCNMSFLFITDSFSSHLQSSSIIQLPKSFCSVSENPRLCYIQVPML